MACSGLSRSSARALEMGFCRNGRTGSSTVMGLNANAIRNLALAFGRIAPALAICGVLLLGTQWAQAQSLSVSPVALPFGVPTGTAGSPPVSAPETVTVNIACNTSVCPVPAPSVSFTSVAVGGNSPALGSDNPADFAVTGTSCTGTFTAPNTCQVTIQYTASKAPATTLETALLTIDSSAGNLTVPLSGAYGSIELFGETNITPSTATFSSLYTIASKQLNLTCQAGLAPTATISGTPDGNGYVLVDNYITLATGPSLTPVSDLPFSSEYPKGNVCGGPGSSTDYDTVNDSDDNNCVSNYYVDEIYNNGFVPTNPDPDSFANPNNTVLPVPLHGSNAGGVPAINLVENIPGFLTAGSTQQALFTLLTSGAELVYDNSTLFLQTNCTAPGIVPGASVTLNPINTSNPASETQTAALDTAPGQNISFTWSTAVALQHYPTIIPPGVVPVITDYPIPQQLFSQLVAGTSAAPAACVRLSGELDTSMPPQPMCKGFLLQCYTPGAAGAAGMPSGDNCTNPLVATMLQDRYLLFTAQYSSPDEPPGYNYLTTQQWAAMTPYTVGQTVVDNNGYVQQATTAGTSSGSYPFPAVETSKSVGTMTPDGGVEWTNEGVNACSNIGPGNVCAQGTGPGLLMGSDYWLCPPEGSLTGGGPTSPGLPCTPVAALGINSAGQLDVTTQTLTSPATYTQANCVFTTVLPGTDVQGALAGALCPLDVMTLMQGAADCTSCSGPPKHPNSLFIPVANMPLPTATASLTSGNGWSNNWTNAPTTAQVAFAANAATYSDPAGNPPGNGFTPAAIYSVTAGLSAGNQPLPDTTYPVTGDTTLTNTYTTPGTPFCTFGQESGNTPLSFSGNSLLSALYDSSYMITPIPASPTVPDGIYNLHYFPTDCAFTEGLLFQPTPQQVTDPTANWASFPYVTVGVESAAAPNFSVSCVPNSGSYNMNVTPSCTVTDENYVAGSMDSGFGDPPPASIQGAKSTVVNVSTNVTAGTSNNQAIAGPQNVCDLAGNCVSVQAGPFNITNVAGTMTAVASSMNPSTFGQAVSFTATVTNTSGTGVTPTGTVQFVVDGSNLGPPVTVLGAGNTGTATSAATATLTVNGGIAHTVTANYVNTDGDFSNSNGTLTGGQTVNPATLSASIIGTPTKTYNGNTSATLISSNFQLTGLQGSDSFTVNQTAGTYASANAGSETVTASLTASNFTVVSGTLANYTLPTSASGPGSITPAPLVITASSATMAQGSTPPTITASYSGFVNGQSASSLTTQPSCSTTATSSSAPGNYPSSCYGAADPNYSISYVNGTVTVTGTWTITPTVASCTLINYVTTIGTTTTCYFTVTNNTATAEPIIVIITDQTNNTHDMSVASAAKSGTACAVWGTTGTTLKTGASCEVAVTYKSDKDDTNGISAVLEAVNPKNQSTVYASLTLSAKD